MFHGPRLCEEFLYLGKWPLCIWKECIFCHVRIYSLKDRLSWLIVWQCLSSHLYISCFSHWKRLLLKYSVNVKALSNSCFILVRFASCILKFIIVCQCLGLLSVYGSSSLIVISNNTPVLKLQTLRYVWTGSQAGSAWSFCCLFLIFVSVYISMGFT